MAKKPVMRELPSYWKPFHGGEYKPEYEVDTGITAERIRELTDGLTKYPEDFHIHPKVQKLLEQRHEMGYGKRPLDFGMAEALAFGSLATQGVPDPPQRTGQPSRHLQPAALGADRYRRTRRNTFRCATWRQTRRGSRSTTPSCPKPR